MSNPHIPFDPDPLDVTHQPGYVLGYEHGWDDAPLDRGRRSPAQLVLVGLVTGVLGFLLGTSVVHAAPPPAQTTERPDVSTLASSGPTGAPLGPVARSSSASGARVTPSPDGGAPTHPAAPAPTSPLIVVVVPRGTEPTATEGGLASWYRDPRRSGFYAAVPSFRWGDQPYRVTVVAGGRSVVVTVVDHCQCYIGTSRERSIDLSPAAFAELAPLGRGLVRVSIEGLRG